MKRDASKLLIWTVATSSVILLSACHQQHDMTGGSSDGHYKSSYFDVGHFDVLDASEASVANIDIENSKPGEEFKVEDKHVHLLKLRLKLTGDKSGSLTLKANEIYVVATNQQPNSYWLAISFFSNVTFTNVMGTASLNINRTILNVDGKTISVSEIDPDTGLQFDFTPGQTTEAELLFNGIDKSEAAAVHFGSVASVNLK